MLWNTDRNRRLRTRTRQMEDPQCQYLLLRFCTCQNLNHWMRTVRPDLMETATQSFDEETLSTLQRLLWCTGATNNNDLTLTPMQIKQARLHSKMGGLGLSSTFLIRQAAWLGSWTQTKNLIKSKLQETSFGNILDTIEDNPYHSVTVQSVKDTYDWMGTPRNSAGLINRYRPWTS